MIQFWLFWTVLFAVFGAEAQPVFYPQPTNQTVIVGGSATFNDVYYVGPFTYQWQFNGTNLGANLENITTIAGIGLDSYFYTTHDIWNGYVRHSYNGGAATNAGIDTASGVAVALDGIGNVFIVDNGDSVILKVSTNGIITTVAGNGTNGYSGDRGTATNAELNSPNGVAIDKGGNVFIADTGNCCIRKITTDGMIWTIAGNGTNGGDFENNGPNGNYVMLNNPKGVAVDSSNNVFIADTGNNRIIKVSANGTISRFAGNGQDGIGDGGAATKAELNLPNGLAIDASGNVFIGVFREFHGYQGGHLGET